MKNLNASVRTKTGKGANRRLRVAGETPAVIYGGDGEATSLSVPSSPLRKLLLGAHRRNTLIGLVIDGGEPVPAMVRELQSDPVTRQLIHCDFVRVDTSKKITVKVPVELYGRSKGVQVGGRLRLVRRVVDLVCLPTEIPATFRVDVTPLDGGDAYRFSECPVADGIEKSFKNDFVVVQCVKGRAAKAST